MTTQRRTLIELGDIVAIEYECRHCHARYSVPVDRADRRPGRCQNCREDWLDPQNGDTSAKGSAVYSDDQLVSEFVGNLREAQRRKFGAAVRIEVSSMEGVNCDEG
jgi:hypothetical protein